MQGSSGSPAMGSYRRLVEQAALRYRDQLASLEGLRDEAAAVRLALVESIEVAIRNGRDFDPSDLPFRWEMLQALNAAEAALFVDQFSLGIGTDGARVVVMGTEEAYDVTKPEELGPAFLYSVLLLC